MSGMELKDSKCFILPTQDDTDWPLADREVYETALGHRFQTSGCERYLGLWIGKDATVVKNFEKPLIKFKERISSWGGVLVGHSSRIFILNVFILSVFSFVLRFLTIPGVGEVRWGGSLACLPLDSLPLAILAPPLGTPRKINISASCAASLIEVTSLFTLITTFLSEARTGLHRWA